MLHRRWQMQLRIETEQHASSSKIKLGTFLEVQLLRLCTSTARAMGSIPGWGTKISYAVWYRQNVKKKKKKKEEEEEGREGGGGGKKKNKINLEILLEVITLRKTDAWFFMTHFKLYSILFKPLPLCNMTTTACPLPSLPCPSSTTQFFTTPNELYHLSPHSSQDKFQNLQHGYQGHLKFSSNLEQVTYLPLPPNTQLLPYWAPCFQMELVSPQPSDGMVTFGLWS